MSSYFTSPATVIDGATAVAADVNDLTTATKAAFDSAEADIGTAAASASAATASAAAALVSENAAAAAEVLTDTDATATAADVVTTNADAVTTTQDAIDTAADAVATAADAVTVAGIYDDFDDRYLGSKAADPALDNDGDALLEGALYWNTTSKVMKAYNSVAWITITSLLDEDDMVSDSSTYGSTQQSIKSYVDTNRKMSNKIINGGFNINQRGVSGSVVLSAGIYGHDRFKAGAAGCSYTFATVANVTTITISAGSLIQVIEGLNLQSGTHTLSWSGTAQGKIGAGGYSSTGVTGTAVGGTNLNIEFNTGTLSFVQFELGSIATSFEQRNKGEEKLLCLRYYEQIGYTASYPQFSGYGTVGTTDYHFVPYKVHKRTSPTVTLVGTWSASNCGQPGAIVAQEGGFRTGLVITANGMYNSYPNSTSNGFTVNAEL